MRNPHRTLAAVLTVAAVAAPAAPAIAHPGGKRAAHAHRTSARRLHFKLSVKINMLVHNGVATPITPSTTFATGDSAYFVADILAGNRKVGREDIICGLSSPTSELCTAVDRLPGGLITHIGANSFTDLVDTDVITGGTGRYLGAHGSALTRFTSATAATLTYVLAG
ncbi:MAG: hypothetical protein ACXVII_37700 [Solirubrobacteraceae bacterium]